MVFHATCRDLVTQRSNMMAVACVILACWIAMVIDREERPSDAHMEGLKGAVPDDMSLIQVPHLRDDRQALHQPHGGAQYPWTKPNLPSIVRINHNRAALNEAAMPHAGLLEQMRSVPIKPNTYLPLNLTSLFPYPDWWSHSHWFHHWRYGPIRPAIVPGFPPPVKHPSVLAETRVQEWLLFAGGMLLFAGIQYFFPLVEPPGKLLALWFGLGIGFTLCIFALLGSSNGGAWISGYVLEVFFSLDNCFVLHIVARGLHLPRRHAKQAFNILVYFLIAFQMMFFLGLATKISRCEFIPYVLGCWLLYSSYLAATEDSETHENEKLDDLYVVWGTKKILGPYFSPQYETSETIKTKEGSLYVTMLPVALFCLVFISFGLEIDVVLIKIETFQNHYIAFTSSAMVAFALPALFLVVEELFDRFHLLKYGIALILGLESLAFFLHSVVIAPTILQFVLIAIVMVSAMILSRMFPPDECTPHSAVSVETGDGSVMGIACQSEADCKVQRWYWSQNEDEVHVEIPCSGEVSEKEIDVRFSKKSLFVSVQNVIIIDSALNGTVSDEDSSWRLALEKNELRVTLRKVSGSSAWQDLLA